MAEVRLNKYLSEHGVCSRREADRLMEEGRISVDGIPASPGIKVTGTERILVDGKALKKDRPKSVVLACYKKAGIVSSTKNQGGEHNNIVDAVGYPERVFPIGRLDKDTTGLILLTNDGSLVNLLLKGKGAHEKEYEVRVAERLSDQDLRQMARGGLELEEGRKTRPCRIRRLSDHRFSCVLTEGMNRQIRKMCATFGYNVVELKRVRFLFLTLEGLSEGEYRELTGEEVRRLRREAGAEKKGSGL